MGACATYHVTRDAALKRVFENMTDQQLGVLLEKVVNDELMKFIIDENGEDDGFISTS